MSRIGKQPVTVPSGVTVTINGSDVQVKGPKGQLERTFSDLVAIDQKDNVVTVTRNDEEDPESNVMQGLVRALINNMVVGVSQGYEKKLELTGVGYRAQLKGKTLELTVGFSHPVDYEAPENITFEVPDNTHITVRGISKEQVGQVAAEVRMTRPPEPYKGKGIHYEGEHIRRKLGKAAK
ncbi:MAG: 50S ribosomal protein L6 [Coriobacteriaceae bacterium]|nr:MAG: 50S ribosomal protein L6 [Coriobacteriaceae bacterium]